MNWKKYINTHTVLILIVVITVAAVVFRFKHWGVKVDLEEIFKDGKGEYVDNLDNITPLTDENGQLRKDPDGITTILFLGNDPLTEDKDSPDGLVNLIAEETGARVYNCGVSNSTMSAVNYVFDSVQAPMDAYNFYWMTVLASHSPIDKYYKGDGDFQGAEEVLGDQLPVGAKEAYETLSNLDMSTVDVLAVMYDGQDYLTYSPVGSDTEVDVLTYAGSLLAGIEQIQATYPHIRIIVMGLPYAYAVDEDGQYVSSDIYTYTGDVLSSYSITACSACVRKKVTYVDNLYGTITEDNAKDCLKDNRLVNAEGRKLLAERFIYALNYYNE